MLAENQTIQLQRQAYCLVEPLGVGGQGTIWKVSGDDGQLYALKIVNLYDTRQARPTRHTAGQMQQLVRYANAEIDFLKALSASQHEHIAPCLDNGLVQQEEFKLPAFVMPLYVQGDLDRRLKQVSDGKATISADLWLRWFRQLMQALLAMQASTLEGRLPVHRDLKPSNCLLDDQGNLFLTDFGIVRESSETGTTSVVYSWHYCAPEQRLARYETEEGNPHFYITPAVDVYSAGMIMHQIIAGGTRAQEQLNEEKTKRLHDRVLHRLDEKPTGKVGMLGEVGGLTDKEFNQLYQRLLAFLQPVQQGDTMVVNQPQLPNYSSIARQLAGLVRRMLAPWPDDRPEPAAVLAKLDEIEQLLQPDLQDLQLQYPKYAVSIGQALTVEVLIKGVGLPKSFDWLQLSLNGAVLEKAEFQASNQGDVFTLALPVFSELTTVTLRLSAEVNGQFHVADAEIEVKPDADYLWITGKRFDALRLDLREDWLDQWETEAQTVADKYQLLQALRELQTKHADHAGLRERYERVNQGNDDPTPTPDFKRVLVLGASAAVLIGVVLMLLFGESDPKPRVVDQVDQKPPIMSMEIGTEDSSPSVVESTPNYPSLTAIKTDLSADTLQTQFSAWQQLKAMLKQYPDFDDAQGLRDEYMQGAFSSDEQAIDHLPLQVLAHDGDMHAQALLGHHYLNAKGTDRDLRVGKFWMQKAAEQGLASAKNTLGIKVLKGVDAADVGVLK